MDELWDVTRVAEYLGVTERTVYNKVRSGELRAAKVGRLWRVRRSDLESWLAGRGRSTASATYPLSAAEESGVRELGAFPDRDELAARLEGIGSQLERRLTFVAVLSSAIEALGWPPPVIVGGNAVEFWTAGSYATVDIDLVGASDPIAQVLAAWGFRREGRHWFDETLGILVEAPTAQLEPTVRARVVSVAIGGMTAHVIGVEDLVVDRLCACVHWNDTESCLWAATLLSASGDIDLAYLRERAAHENVTDALERVLAGETGR